MAGTADLINAAAASPQTAIHHFLGSVAEPFLTVRQCRPVRHSPTIPSDVGQHFVRFSNTTLMAFAESQQY
jgi:hypothetical protein